MEAAIKMEVTIKMEAIIKMKVIIKDILYHAPSRDQKDIADKVKVRVRVPPHCSLAFVAHFGVLWPWRGLY